MATKKTYWECGYCKRLFDEEEHASQCEQHHAGMAHMQVIDSVDAEPDGPFPEKILLRNDREQSHLAEYALSKQGPVADFYQSQDHWSQP
jgi:hypothetical protein